MWNLKFSFFQLHNNHSSQFFRFCTGYSIHTDIQLQQVLENTHFRYNTTLKIIALNLSFYMQALLLASERRIIEKMKRDVDNISLSEENCNLQIVPFLKLIQSLIFKQRREMKYARFDVATNPIKKWICQLHDTMKLPEFVSRVNENPGSRLRNSLENYILSRPLSDAWFMRTFIWDSTWWGEDIFSRG